MAEHGERRTGDRFRVRDGGRGTGARHRRRRRSGRSRREGPHPASRRSTGTASSRAPPARARRRRCRGSPASCRTPGCPCCWPTSRATSPAWPSPARTTPRSSRASKDTGDDWTPTAYPVEFLSLGGKSSAIPIRATLTQFGPILLSKVLDLNDTQESTLGLIFHWADQQGLPLLDTKDLRAVIQHLTSDEGKADLKGIGGVSSATAGVILRALVNLEAAGGEDFFGEPEFEPADLLRVGGRQGRRLAARAGRPGGQPAPVLHVPHVAARRAVRDAARGGRPRQAQARLLLRRGPPALHRRVQGVPGAHRADREAHPVQGRGRVLLHAAAHRRAQRRAVASSAPACSTHCARSRRRTRRRWPRRSRPTRTRRTTTWRRR